MVETSTGCMQQHMPCKGYKVEVGNRAVIEQTPKGYIVLYFGGEISSRTVWKLRPSCHPHAVNNKTGTAQ